MPATGEVTIVGGGVIGCAAAWWLARRGASVEVLEAEAPGAGASSAAAGVLGPLSDSIAPGFMTGFALDALREIDTHAEPIAEASGVDIGYRRSGVLRVARTDAGVAALDGFVARRDGLGLRLHRLDAAQLRAFEPRLGPDVRAGVYCPEEAHVLPGALTRALAEAARRGGARFRTGVRVTGVERDGDTVTALRTATERIPVAALVVAAGTGAAALGETLGVPLPVRPVRGGMAALSPDPRFAEAPIFAEDVLLVPKPSGELWVGATHDDGNADPRPTAGDLAALMPEAIAVAPELARAPFLGVGGAATGHPGRPAGAGIAAGSAQRLRGDRLLPQRHPALDARRSRDRRVDPGQRSRSGHHPARPGALPPLNWGTRAVPQPLPIGGIAPGTPAEPADRR